MLQAMLNDVQAATESAIRCGDWNRYEGRNSKKLELLLAEKADQPFVQLTSSGTAALEILLRAAGLNSDGEVMISSYDYPGNFWAIERVGARPVLVDTEPSSWRVNQQSLDEVFRPACKALVVSHLHGQLQKMDQLLEWCNARNVLLIEDACQAIGATWLGRPVGSYGHAAMFSFGGGKLLSCGRGGAWATADETLATRARVAGGAGSGPYLISELQAAVVCAQWDWLNAINANSRDYFHQLEINFNSSSEGWQFASRDSLPHTAYYQCGWITASSDPHRQELLSALRRIPPAGDAPALQQIPFGVGFPGFHRRSRKRCRIDTTLSNAINSADKTLVLHHSIALQQSDSANAQWAPSEVASWIKKNIEITLVS